MGSVSYYWKIVRSDSIELDFKEMSDLVIYEKEWKMIYS